MQTENISSVNCQDPLFFKVVDNYLRILILSHFFRSNSISTVYLLINESTLIDTRQHFKTVHYSPVILSNIKQCWTTTALSDQLF